MKVRQIDGDRYAVTVADREVLVERIAAGAYVCHACELCDCAHVDALEQRFFRHESEDEC